MDIGRCLKLNDRINIDVLNMDKRVQITEKAVFLWEIGLLRFMFDKGVLSREEYSGIRRIAEEQAGSKIIVL